MNAEHYAEFLERSGSRVRRTRLARWVESSPRIWMSFPYQISLDASQVMRELPLGPGDVAARFPCDLAQGRPSYRLVCRTPSYGLEHLDSKARNQTRRGLERCAVERVEPASLRRDAAELEMETRRRQGRTGGDPALWNRLLSAAEAVKGAQTWAALVNGRVGALLLAFETDQWLHVTHVRSRREALPAYANNALLYELNRRCMISGCIKAVSIGFESMQSDVDDLERFKVAMGFARETVGCRLACGPAGRALLALRRWSPTGRLLRRLAGAESCDKLDGLGLWIREQPLLGDQGP